MDVTLYNSQKAQSSTSLDTFFMKNVFFQFLETKESHHQWQHDYLSLRYAEGLEYVIDCLANRGITRYFIDTLNILGDSSNVQKA